MIAIKDYWLQFIGRPVNSDELLRYLPDKSVEISVYINYNKYNFKKER